MLNSILIIYLLGLIIIQIKLLPTVQIIIILNLTFIRHIFTLELQLGGLIGG